LAAPAAYGDPVAAILAGTATLALSGRASVATLLVWVFNVWGTADLLFAFYQGQFGIQLDVGMLGAAFFIPTAVVPPLLITHGLIFWLLVRPGRKAPMSTTVKAFRLARMSPLILTLTLVLMLLPLVFFASAAFGKWPSAAPGLLLVAIYAWVWLRFRPSRFVVRSDALEVIWPLKFRRIPRKDIADVRLIDRGELRREIGWGMRVGAGGLWGGFGWLWTRQRGIVQMYVSRTDAFVWIERISDRPWLVTPEEPETFVRALS